MRPLRFRPIGWMGGRYNVKAHFTDVGQAFDHIVKRAVKELLGACEQEQFMLKAYGLAAGRPRWGRAGVTVSKGGHRGMAAAQGLSSSAMCASVITVAPWSGRVFNTYC